MPLEAGTTIEQLDSLWPLGGDPLLQGDDHIRLIKSILKAQFPGALGQGFNIAITATEAELNYLSGVTSSIQDQLDAITSNDNLIAPAGTVLLFASVAPPVGWTQNIDDDKAMLQLVSDASGGAAGGTEDFLSVWTHKHTTGDHQLTPEQMPAHTHVYTFRPTQTVSGGSGEIGVESWTTTNVTEPAGGDEAHNHGETGEITFEPKYLNVISATKD